MLLCNSDNGNRGTISFTEVDDVHNWNVSKLLKIVCRQQWLWIHRSLYISLKHCIFYLYMMLPNSSVNILWKYIYFIFSEFACQHGTEKPGQIVARGVKIGVGWKLYHYRLQRFFHMCARKHCLFCSGYIYIRTSVSMCARQNKFIF